MCSVFNHKLLPLCFCLLSFTLSAQPGFRRDTLSVLNSSNVLLKNPWTGGHNFTQLSDVDLNLDGIKDLVVFDRTGVTPWDKVTTYLNIGTPNQVAYVHAPQYQDDFPYVHNWMLLVDYNCDGMEDIFTYQVGGFSVFKNTSTVSNLQFTLEKLEVYSLYIPSTFIKLYVSPADIPAFIDMDNDGDLDVATFDFSGVKVELHKNMSMEMYGTCDSLVYIQMNQCWGNFTENTSWNL